MSKLSCRSAFYPADHPLLLQTTHAQAGSSGQNLSWQPLLPLSMAAAMGGGGTGAAAATQEPARVLVVLASNVPMGVTGFGDAIVMHIALTLCGLVCRWDGRLMSGGWPRDIHNILIATRALDDG